MKTIQFTIEGVSRISFSAPIKSVRNTGEGHNDFEERTWRERLHVDTDGNVFIPPQAVKNCLAECAKYLSETVPGKGKATYTKHFEAGILCVKPLPILTMQPVKKKSVQGETWAAMAGTDIEGERVFVPSDGRRGGGSRVWKTFPFIEAGWQASGELVLLDPLLIDKPGKVEEYLRHAGKFIGLGRFRPRNNGYYGRFEVVAFE